MILVNLWAWLLYQSPVRFKCVSDGEAFDAFYTFPTREELARFKQSAFYQQNLDFARYVQPETDSISFLVHKGAPSSLEDATVRRTSRLPKNALWACYLEDFGTIYVPAPEYYFALRKIRLPLVHQVLLANQLVGKWRFAWDPTTTSATIYTVRQPLTTLKKLKMLAPKAQALNFVQEHMESPRESALATMLVLPKKDGGCALPTPLANAELKVHKSLLTLTHTSTIRPDFLWPLQNLVLEYDGMPYHTTPKKVQRDKERIFALTSMGYRVVVITKRLLDNTKDRMSLLQTVASALDAPFSPQARWEWRHRELAQLALARTPLY